MNFLTLRSERFFLLCRCYNTVRGFPPTRFVRQGDQGALSFFPSDVVACLYAGQVFAVIGHQKRIVCGGGGSSQPVFIKVGAGPPLGSLSG